VSTKGVRGAGRALSSRILDPLPGKTAPRWRVSGLSVFLAGTGTPNPARGRAGPCVAVVASGKLYLVDAGPGSWAVLVEGKLPLASLSGVFITHFHSDHIGGLGEACAQSWLKGRRIPLPVYGPPGVERLVRGFNEAYALDASYRVAGHGAEALPPEAALMEARPIAAVDAETVALGSDGLRVTAFAVDHGSAAPAFGYRFEHRGASIVVSGDTRISERLFAAARGADLLIHDAFASRLLEAGKLGFRALGHDRLARMMEEAAAAHAGAPDVLAAARSARVGKLVITHASPSLPPLTPQFVLRWVFLGRPWRPMGMPVVFGRDGAAFRVGGSRRHG